MKIAIDGYEANVPQRLGSSRVAFELLRNLEKIDKKNSYTIFLPSPPLTDLPKERLGWKYKILKPKIFWTKIALPIALYTSGEKFDLIFSPTHYIPRFSPYKRVATIFDLSFLRFPESFLKKDLWQLKNGTKFSILFADKIITISNSSKQDICKHYQIDPNKVIVAYPGFDKDIFHPQQEGNQEGVKQKYNLSDNYIIYIGTIQPRKNLTHLIEAFSHIILSDKQRVTDSLQLVIVGKAEGEGRKGWMYQDILQSPKKFGVEDSVIFTGFVPQDDLVSLLSGAQALIQPSLWEGFGIPVVEAMASGTPVLVSDVSSLPEIVGGAGLTFNPNSLAQIEVSIRSIISDRQLRQRYSKLGLEQAKKFSWEKMARTVLKVFAEG